MGKRGTFALPNDGSGRKNPNKILRIKKNQKIILDIKIKSKSFATPNDGMWELRVWREERLKKSFNIFLEIRKESQTFATRNWERDKKES